MTEEFTINHCVVDDINTIFSIVTSDKGIRFVKNFCMQTRNQPEPF